MKNRNPMTRHCTLSDPHARKVVAKVWRHLRKHFPDDARVLSGIVRRIVPVTDDEEMAGYQGFWVLTLFRTTQQQQAFREFTPHGQGYGLIKLLDNRDLTVRDFAHELGHAFTTPEEVLERKSPNPNWAHEAAADMHAVRWGLTTIADIEKRHMCSGGSYAKTGWGGDARLHHGPAPSDIPFEYNGKQWILLHDFVFEPYVPPVRKPRKRKPSWP